MNSNNKKTTPGPLRRLESRALPSEAISSQVQFEQTESESPTSPSSKTTLPSDEVLREFEKLTVSHLQHKSVHETQSTSSHDENSCSSSSSSKSSATESGRVDDIIHKPRFADNSARQARVVSIGQSPTSDSSSARSSTSSEDDVFSTTAVPSLGASKLGNAWSFACSGSAKHSQQNSKSSVHGPSARPTPQANKSATNIRNAGNRLAKQPKNKIRNLAKPNRMEVISENNVAVDETPSPPFTPSVSARKMPLLKEPLWRRAYTV